MLAVDPTTDHPSILEDEAHRRGLENVCTIPGGWEEVGPVTADVAVCYGVMGAVEDAATFLAKLDACVHRRVLVGIYVGVDVLRDPLWRHFRGADAPPTPGWLDAVAVLRELGIEPEVDFDDLAESSYDDLPEAVVTSRNLLQLPETTALDGELGAVLSSWLQRGPDGRFRPPFRTAPWATVSWTPQPAGRT